MSSDMAIQVSNLSKCYQIYDKPQDRLKQGMWRGRKQFFREFWALKDVSFDVKKGETLGIVGRNGSGKSTLLQMICGTLTPTAGDVSANGRIAALLELGAGFNQEFSGRENVYMNGALLGLSKQEIDARFDEIIAFADIGPFIDQPVKTYSSGMYVRLAFAVSACVEPDILIVDEALSVGDVKFQAKCFRRFQELVSRGTTVLLVTHSTEQLTRHCDSAILLESGSIRKEGHPKDVANYYLDLLFGVTSDRPSKPDRASSHEQKTLMAGRYIEQGFELRAGYNRYEHRWGSRDAEITDFHISADILEHTNVINSGVETIVAMSVKFRRPVLAPIYGLTIKTPDGVTIYSCNSRDFSAGPLVRSAEHGDKFQVVFRIDQSLGAGDYLLSLGVVEEIAGELIPLDRRYDAVHIKVLNERSRASGVVDFDMRVEINRQAA